MDPTLFDADGFYDPASDPWNQAPPLGEDVASDDDLQDWGLPHSGSLSGFEPFTLLGSQESTGGVA